LNAFALDYCDMTIKSILQLFANIMGWFKQCGEISAISRHYLIVQYCCEWHFQKILLHHIVLSYKLRYFFGAFKMIWPMELNLGFCPRSGFQCLSVFFSTDLGFLWFNCVAVI